MSYHLAGDMVTMRIRKWSFGLRMPTRSVGRKRSVTVSALRLLKVRLHSETGRSANASKSAKGVRRFLDRQRAPALKSMKREYYCKMWLIGMISVEQWPNGRSLGTPIYCKHKSGLIQGHSDSAPPSKPEQPETLMINVITQVFRFSPGIRYNRINLVWLIN